MVCYRCYSGWYFSGINCFHSSPGGSGSGSTYYLTDTNHSSTDFIKIVAGIGIALCNMVLIWTICIIIYTGRGQIRNYKKLQEVRQKRGNHAQPNQQELIALNVGGQPVDQNPVGNEVKQPVQVDTKV